MERRLKGELESNRRELDPCIERRWTGEESLGVVRREETDGEENSER
jgi:hypothetical protein